MKLHHVGIRRPVNGLSAIMIEEILGQKPTKKIQKEIYFKSVILYQKLTNRLVTKTIYVSPQKKNKV